MQRTLIERAAGPLTIRIVEYAPGTVMAGHAHDGDTLSVVLDGSFVEEAHHDSVVVHPGWVVVKPAGTRHANRFGQRTATLICVALDESFGAELDRRWQWLHPNAAYRAALRLFRTVLLTNPVDQQDAVVELMSAIAVERPCASEDAWLRRVARILDAPDGLSVSVTDLARHAGVHPVYLARRFRGAFGVAPTEYRKIAQVRRATSFVMGTERPLSVIAHECGFADHSHMCRSFRRVAGVKPASLRL